MTDQSLPTTTQTRFMKTTQTIHAPNCLLLASLIILSGALAAQAGTQIKANNTTAINAAGSWNAGSGPVPGSGDIGEWNSVVTAANTVAVGGPLTVGQVQIANPTGNVSISDATTANILT